MKTEDIIVEVERLISPPLKENGLDVWAVEFAASSGTDLLRVFIESGTGVDVEECAKASRIVKETLEGASILRRPYVLEVSSPGIERKLYRPQDYERFLGQRVKVRTKEKRHGRRSFSGYLVQAGPESFKIDSDDESFEITYSDVSVTKIIAELKI